MDDLRNQLSRFPEAWRPKPGDMLIGVLVDVDERTGFAGDRYPVLTVRTEGGDELVFHAYHAVAKGEIGRLEPQLGETIGIAYHGPHPEKGYARYRIKVVRDQEPVDWAAIRADADAELAAHTADEGDGDDIPF